MSTMYKCIVVVALLLSELASAQTVSVAAGKKCKMVIDTKMTTGMSMMGQDVEVESNNLAYVDIEVKSVTNNGYTIINTVKRIKGSVNAMGTEQDFDSDDSSVRNNPQMGEAFKILDKPQEITFENGKIVSSSELASLLAQYGGSQGDAAKLFLVLPFDKLIKGFQWADSSITKEARTVNHYEITKVEDAQMEVTVQANLQTNGTLKQGGMEVKQKMLGTLLAKRIYQKSTGILLSEITETAMAGTAEIMGMTSPVKVKGTIHTTVE